jgi:hypothetical protein
LEVQGILALHLLNTFAEPILYDASDKGKMKVDVTKVSEFIEMKRLINPRLSIRELIREALA